MEMEMDIDDNIESQNLFEKCLISISMVLKTVSTTYQNSISNLIKEDRKKLHKNLTEVNKLNEKTKLLKNNVSNVITRLPEDDVEAGHYYVQAIDYLREITHCMNFITKPSYEHIDNNHKGLLKQQSSELKKLSDDIGEFFNFVQFVIKEHKYNDIDEIIKRQQFILDEIVVLKKNHLKRVKNMEAGTKNTMLYFEILAETKNLILFTVNMLKAQRDFVKENKAMITKELPAV